MFEVGETYKNRSGEDVRIVANDRAGFDYPIVGLVSRRVGLFKVAVEDVQLFTLDGKYTARGEGEDVSPFDLVPPKRKFVLVEDVCKMFIRIGMTRKAATDALLSLRQFEF